MTLIIAMNLRNNVLLAADSGRTMTVNGHAVGSGVVARKLFHLHDQPIVIGQLGDARIGPDGERSVSRSIYAFGAREESHACDVRTFANNLGNHLSAALAGDLRAAHRICLVVAGYTTPDMDGDQNQLDRDDAAGEGYLVTIKRGATPEIEVLFGPGACYVECFGKHALARFLMSDTDGPIFATFLNRLRDALPEGATRTGIERTLTELSMALNHRFTVTRELTAEQGVEWAGAMLRLTSAFYANDPGRWVRSPFRALLVDGSSGQVQPRLLPWRG